MIPDESNPDDHIARNSLPTAAGNLPNASGPATAPLSQIAMPAGQSAAARFIAYAIILVGILLRLRIYLHRKSIWFDEALVVENILHRSYRGLLGVLDNNQGAPVGFLWTVKLATQLFGTSEYALRLPAFVAGIATLFLFYRVAKLLVTPTAMLVGLSIFSLSISLIYYSNETKQYGIDCTVALIILALAIPALQTGLAPKLAVAMGFAGAIGIWFSHPAAFMVAGAAIVTAAFRPRPARDFWRKWLIAFGPFFASCALSYVVSLHALVKEGSLLAYWNGAFLPFPPTSSTEIRWFPATYYDVIGYLFRSFDGIYLGERFAMIGGLFVALGIYSFFKRDRKIAWLLVSPILFCLLASALHKYPVNGRLMLFAFPAIVLSIAEGFDLIVGRVPSSQQKCIKIITILMLLPMPAMTATDFVHKPVLNWHKHTEHRLVARGRKHIAKATAYLHFPAAYSYYADRYPLENVTTIQGNFADTNRQALGPDIAKLAGRPRVWLLFTHIVPPDPDPHDDAQMLTKLVGLSPPTDALRLGNSAVYLVDLSQISEPGSGTTSTK
jgi:hypothetical protein